ncbi:PREDICTED: spindle assembly checkpoint kinase-like, partial [Rhagoletis zephyria]|uniref:spindle assembly checkpoint kinase-like n=1 Tax=Rhagoletis zephyria TaxID=28612 RepID=UPI0008113876
MALAFEPMIDRSLADYVSNHWQEPFVACLMLQLLLAFSYLHSKGIVHNDVKPGNILVGNGTVKIADFGKAMYLEEELQEEGKPNKNGTILYTAPEMARARLRDDNSKKELSTSIDIWALGATLYELLEGNYSFYEYDKFSVLSVIKNHGLYLTKDKEYSPTLKSFFSL